MAIKLSYDAISTRRVVQYLPKADALVKGRTLYRVYVHPEELALRRLLRFLETYSFYAYNVFGYANGGVSAAYLMAGTSSHAGLFTEFQANPDDYWAPEAGSHTFWVHLHCGIETIWQEADRIADGKLAVGDTSFLDQLPAFRDLLGTMLATYSVKPWWRNPSVPETPDPSPSPLLSNSIPRLLCALYRAADLAGENLYSAITRALDLATNPESGAAASTRFHVKNRVSEIRDGFQSVVQQQYSARQVLETAAAHATLFWGQQTELWSKILNQNISVGWADRIDGWVQQLASPYDWLPIPKAPQLPCVHQCVL